MPPALDASARAEQNRRRAAALVNRVLLALAVPVSVLGLVVVALTGAWLLVLAVVVVVGALLGAASSAMRSGGDRLLSVSGARPATPQQDPRLHNVVDGLAVAHGLPIPSLHVVDLDSANIATVTLRSREPAVIVTRGLLDGLERIELEGVLAHELCHVRDGDTSVGTLVAAVASGGIFAPLRPLLAGVLGGALDPEAEQRADLAAVALTRYPPGLAAALDRLRHLDTTVPGVPASAAHLWLLDPGPKPADGSLLERTPVDVRVAVLREL